MAKGQTVCGRNWVYPPRTKTILSVVFGLICCGLSGLAAPALGEGVNRAALTGVAIGGYDPVAYWTLGKPVRGELTITVEWRHATWRFASRRHQSLFLANPEKYAPQFGGYCAYGIGRGIKSEIHPYFWRIDQDRLFLFFSADALSSWTRDQKRLQELGARQWAVLGNSVY